MQYALCMDCDYCKTDRKNEQGLVRCTRFSKYVNANDMECEAFHKEVHSSREFCEFIKSLEMR